VADEGELAEMAAIPLAVGPDPKILADLHWRYTALEAIRLIEQLNRHAAPGYFLHGTAQATALLREIAAPNLKLMFDCYHVQVMEGDLTRRLTALKADIGHIQFAGVPARGRPDVGEVNFAHVFHQIAELGWTRPLGAEYRPAGSTEASLGWMTRLR